MPTFCYCLGYKYNYENTVSEFFIGNLTTCLRY